MTGSELREALRILGWSQRQFADIIDHRAETVSRWVHDRVEIRPHIEELVRQYVDAKRSGRPLPRAPERNNNLRRHSSC